MNGPDFVVTGPGNRILLVVEAKARRNADDSWADSIRETIPESKDTYFLLVTQDEVRLWKPQAISPDVKLPTRQALDPFFRRANPDLATDQSLEMRVSSWLNLVLSTDLSKEREGRLKWIFDTGLYDRIKDGLIVENVA